MSNLVLERIKQRNTPPSVEVAMAAIKAVAKRVPISLDELRAALMQEFQCAPVVVVNDLHFESIYDFVPWYSAHKEKFTPQQRTALDSLEHSRAMIDSGCACKRTSREAIAHQYFETFWRNNSGTDLLATIANIAGANKVSVNAFCVYPHTPETSAT
jgi:hypothetical protein